MSRILALASFVGSTILAAPQALAQTDPVFIRADANSDGAVDISDGIHILNYLFSGGVAPRCPAIADANGSGTVDISDGITVLNYLFSSVGDIPPLTEGEIQDCISPPPPTAVRCGSLGTDGPDPIHGIRGCVQQMSDGTIRLSEFFYDGEGTPHVVVYLQKFWSDSSGVVISPDLLRNQPYVRETLSFPIPPGVSSDQFRYVSIWCDDFPLHYAVAQLRAPPCFLPCLPE